MGGAASSRDAGESMRGAVNPFHLPALCVTNISEETQENDLRMLFGVFGRVARVYMGRDRQSGAGEGLSRVRDKVNAQKAIKKVHGVTVTILSVQWSREAIVISPLHLRLDVLTDPLGRTADEQFATCTIFRSVILVQFQRVSTCP